MDERRPYAAGFAPGDPPAVVAAAFACPHCLAAATAVRLVDAFALPVAEVRCGCCGAIWQTELTLAQLAVLVLGDAAGALPVRLGPQAVRLRALL